MVPHLQAKAGELYARHPRKALASAGLFFLLAVVGLVFLWLNREFLLGHIAELRAWSIQALEGIPAFWYLVTMILAPAFGAPLSIFLCDYCRSHGRTRGRCLLGLPGRRFEHGYQLLHGGIPVPPFVAASHGASRLQGAFIAPGSGK